MRINEQTSNNNNPTLLKYYEPLKTFYGRLPNCADIYLKHVCVRRGGLWHIQRQQWKPLYRTNYWRFDWAGPWLYSRKYIRAFYYLALSYSEKRKAVTDFRT